jgi:methylglutaconyl-CoA hydratase
MTTDAKPEHGGGPAVRYEVAAGVATLTLDRPEARNVLGPESLAELRIGLDEAAADDAVRVVVLTGSGSAFCAGADLRGASSADAGSFSDSGPLALVGVLERLLDHPKPTIARVQGHVAGGGNGLVAACDLAVAVDSAKFAFSEVRVGVAPAVISVVCLRRMPPREAAALLLTGERVSAQRAHQAGLLTTVAHDHDALDAQVADWVGQLLQGGPLALAATKELLRRVPTLDRAEGFAYTARLSADLFRSEEALEGMTAFVQRRPPAWAPPPADLA